MKSPKHGPVWEPIGRTGALCHLVTHPRGFAMSHLRAELLHGRMTMWRCGQGRTVLNDAG